MLDVIKLLVRDKKSPAVDDVILETFYEGLSAQIMHVGPYSEERQIIQCLNEFIKENDYKLRDRHHEIYMSDPQRSKPENKKTIIHQPVEKK